MADSEPSLYRLLADRVDDETGHLSGGYESKESFQKLLQLDRVLPSLIEDLRNEMGSSRWRINMINELAISQLNQCIYYQPEMYKLDETVNHTLKWWGSVGLSSYLNSNND